MSLVVFFPHQLCLKDFFSNLGGSDKDMMDNNVIAIKILFCVTKALIQNVSIDTRAYKEKRVTITLLMIYRQGCARVNQTAALTGKADISTSILVDSAASWMDVRSSVFTLI